MIRAVREPRFDCIVMQFAQTSYYVYKDVTCRGATKSVDSRKLPPRKPRLEFPFFTNQKTGKLLTL